LAQAQATHFVADIDPLLLSWQAVRIIQVRPLMPVHLRGATPAVGAMQQQKKQHQATGEKDSPVSTPPMASGSSSSSSNSSVSRTHMAAPMPYSLHWGTYAGDEEEDAEFASVISASLVSAPSSESTAVYSYLEELKKVADYNEEAKSIQRIMARRELRRQAKTLSTTADELSVQLLRAKASRKAPASPGSSTLSVNTTDRPSLPALTESSVRLADAADAQAGSDEQLWRRRLELSMTGSSGMQREDPFPIGPTLASLQQTLEATQLTPPRSENDRDTSEETSDEELWKERLRLYLDNASASSCHISSRAPSRFPVEFNEEEDWEDLKSSLTSLLDSVRANSNGMTNTNATNDAKSPEGREQEPRARPGFCSFLAIGLAVSMPIVAGALTTAAAMW